MPSYKELDPTKRLLEGAKIPSVFLDLPQIIAEKQAKKVMGRSVTIDSEQPAILEEGRSFSEVNRIHELMVQIEELLSLFGQVILILEPDTLGNVRLTFADPYYLSRIGKFYLDEKVASVFKYVVRDTKTYPVYEEWTEKTKKVMGLDPNQEVQVDSLRAKIPELEKGSGTTVTEVRHNLGCLPVVEMRNKQKWVYELMSPGSWKPQLATWYNARGMIKWANHTAKQIGKNMIIVKPKLVGEFEPQDIARYSEDLSEVYSDVFLRLKNTGGIVGEKGSNLDILQGELRIREGFEGFEKMIDHIFIACGFSPLNDSSAMKTTSEIYANQEVSKETLNLLRQLRIDQGSRVFDKVLIIKRLGDGKGERPYTLSIPEEENMNGALALEESEKKVALNFSNYITEIAKMNGVSRIEALKIMKENIKINKQVFEETKEMRETQEGQEETKAGKASKGDKK